MSTVQNRIETVKKLQEIATGTLWDIKDMKIPKIEFIAEKMIAAGQVHFLFGLGGTFKSTIMLYLAICICNGSDTIFGKTTKSNILWIDEEMGIEGLALKTNLIARSIGIKDEEWKKSFHYRSMTGFSVESAENTIFINTEIQKNDISCLFIDSLTAVTEGETDENARKLRNFNKTAYKTGCAIIHIHHIPKANAKDATLTKESLRGSVDFGNQADMAFAVTNVGGHFRIDQDKGRHIKRSDYIDINIDIKETEDCMSFEYVGETKDISVKSKDIRFKSALAWAIKHVGSLGNPQIQVSDLIKQGKFKGFSSDDIRDVVYRKPGSLVDIGMVKNGSKQGWYIVV